MTQQKTNSQPISALFASDEENKRDLRATIAQFAAILSIIIALFHLYAALISDVSELTRNAVHFAGFALLSALVYPCIQRYRTSTRLLSIDILFGVLVALSALYLANAEDAIYARGVKLSPLDWAAGITVIIGAIELTRRSTGLIIPALVITALSYVTWLGPLIPGVFAFKGLSAETVLFRSIYGDDAIFGSIARISSTYVFLFIIFGAFLLRSGAGDFVINVSRAIAGKMVGGPGLVAVISSGLTGTISGSAVANTASTGVITIPLMKRAGFPATFAAAVEASASTGGQLMPPIMGAGAFVMASYTQIAYEHIVAVAALPALLYFASVAFFVRIEAKKHGLKTVTESEVSLWQAVKSGGASFIIPIGLLIGLLVAGLTPTYAAVIGIIAVIASSWLTENKMGPRAVLEALALGSKNMIMTAVLLCTVGLVVNVIATAGIGNTFSLMIADWADGNLLIAIVLIGLASLVLGMGLPVTAAYIVLATLSAPALANMIADSHLLELMASGNVPPEAHTMFMLINPEALTLLSQSMPRSEAQALLDSIPPDLIGIIREQVVPGEILTTAILSAHMIIFWLSQDSNVTPPLCLASFTAAAIAKSPPMKTGFSSWKIAKGLYIVPILFAYTPFLSGDWFVACKIFAFGLFGVYAIAAAMEGHMETALNPALRIIALVLGVGCLWPNLWIDSACVMGVIALFIYNKRADNSTTA